MQLQHLLSNFEQIDRIWYSKSFEPVSYPEEGHALCFGLEEHSFWFRHRNSCILEALKNFPPQGTLLDVGGGNGCVSNALEKAGYETVLLEPGRQGATNARRRGLPRIICGTLEQARFPPGAFPAAGLFDVLEHIEDPGTCLTGLHRVLASEGKLYLSVPAFSFLWSAEDKKAGHFRRYTRSTLTRELAAAGFELSYFTYFFSLLLLPIFFRRSLPFLLGRAGKTLKESATRDHQSSFSKLAGTLLKPECDWIKKKKSIPFGSSCLAVATKK